MPAGEQVTRECALTRGCRRCLTDVTVVQSPHPALLALVMEAVAKWRYEPTRVQEVPVTADVTLTVTFQATARH